MKQNTLTLDSFIKDKDGVYYKHPERTCKDCIKYPCFDGQEENTSCDFAKYGCIHYADFDMQINKVKSKKNKKDVTSSPCKIA